MCLASESVSKEHALDCDDGSTSCGRLSNGSLPEVLVTAQWTWCPQATPSATKYLQ